MIAVPHPPKMTAEAYLLWESQQEMRHEYFDGELFAMSGGTLAHNQLALNLYSALRPSLQQKGCRAFVADAKVNVTRLNAYFYPDLAVSRGEGRMWLYTRYEAGETLELQSLGIEVAVDAIYEGVQLNVEPPHHPLPMAE